MDRHLATLAASLLFAFVPATRGQDLLPLPLPLGPAFPSPEPATMEPGPGVPWVAPMSFCPPGDPLFFNQRGISELARGEYEQAIADFDEALRRAPTRPDFYFNRALANFRAEHFNRALGDLFDALLRDPNKTDYYLARARVFTRLDRFDRARDDYNTVLRDQPSNVEAFAEREELKVREALYAALNPPVTPAPPPTPPQPTALQQAQDEAAIAEVHARREKALLDAEMYRRQRMTATPPAKTTTTPPPVDLSKAAADENLKAQIAISKALEAKAWADQVQYLKQVGTTPPPTPAEKPKEGKPAPQ